MVSAWVLVSPGIIAPTVNATAGLEVMSIVPLLNVAVDAAVSVKMASDIAPAPTLTMPRLSRAARARRRCRRAGLGNAPRRGSVVTGRFVLSRARARACHHVHQTQPDR